MNVFLSWRLHDKHFLIFEVFDHPIFDIFNEIMQFNIIHVGSSLIDQRFRVGERRSHSRAGTYENIQQEKNQFGAFW
jgi:hypothetical protein